MRINTPFYVHNEKDELVPAKFLVGPDGQYITNPNTTPNTINWRATHYFNADGSELRYANPGNYLVVPYNYTLGQASQFVSDLNDAVSEEVSPDMMMAAAFVGKGSQNLQRTYQNADGSMTYGGFFVPIFEDELELYDVFDRSRGWLWRFLAIKNWLIYFFQICQLITSL